MITRRNALQKIAVSSAAVALPRFLSANAFKNKDFYIGACDWSIGKKADLGAMELASKIGLDGVQVSLGTVENNMHLRQRAIQKEYKKLSKKYGVKIGGMAIGELNRIPYKSDDRTDAWVSDSIDVAAELNCKVILLAFFGKGDIKNDIEGTNRVIEKLQKVAPKAERAGVILGIESWLSAEEHVHIIDNVGSSHVKVYYDTANSHKMGYNIYEEIKWLGEDRICEFHMKENGNLLGQGEVDFVKVKECLSAINYKGWMQIEGAIPEGGAVLESYQANLKFLNSFYS